MPVRLLRGWLLALVVSLVLALPFAASPSAGALVGCLVVVVAVAFLGRGSDRAWLRVAPARRVPAALGAHPVVRQSQPTAPGRTQARAPGRMSGAPLSA